MFDAVHGVEPQSETVWRQADKYGVPRICFINKMDKMGADFEHAVDTIRKRLNARPVAIQIPIGQEASFKGVIDLMEMKAIIWHDESMGAKYEVEEIPAELRKKAEAFRAQLVESGRRKRRRHAAQVPRRRDHHRRRTEESLRKSVIGLKVFPVLVRNGIQEQRRADAAGCGGRLPAFAAGCSAGRKARTRTIREKVLERKPDDSEPFSGLAFKIMTDPFVGQLAFIRVYSGHLKTGDSVLNTAHGKTSASAVC